jgi:threonine dehydrogenase-like Zn-dependent dehydrogenase
MKAGIFFAPRDIRIQEIPDPKLLFPTDALLRITYSCICGSDLWYYRGLAVKASGSRVGHELLGIVREVGTEVKHIKVGDTVVAPFSWSDGTCPACQNGITSCCWNGASWGNKETGGGQGEMTRVPFADTNLFVIPKNTAESMMPALLALSDVLCTGHHAAVSAGVTSGSTVAVIGDGAVGLCAVLASKRLGAKRIILMSRNESRSAVGEKFGATDVIEERGDEGVEKIRELTENVGVDCALECVGTDDSWHLAIHSTRAGGKIGYVGVPHGVTKIDITRMFRQNIGAVGGVAPVAQYIPNLISDVLSGTLDASPVFDLILPLSDLTKGYEAMDQRTAIKVLIKP